MKMIVGSRKQEMKINEMGAVANTMFPEIKTMEFKGSFRLGVRNALQKSGYGKWDEISLLPPDKRNRFFENIIQESLPYLKKIGLDEKDINRLIRELKQRNLKYLYQYRGGEYVDSSQPN